MRQSPLVYEKSFGNISSFNFTRAAFIDKKWNSLTSRARGLYIDTANMKIVARGYEKFFNINERRETELTSLQKNLAFPIEVFRKENGFLGLVSYDKSNDSLFMTTKSAIDGKMAELFRSMFTDEQKKALTEFLKERDITLLFEAVNPVHDPHIIEYEQQHLFLLDAVKNKLEFAASDYDELVDIASELGLEVKKRTDVLKSWDDFLTLYDESRTLLDNPNITPFEGYVIRDANGFMFKVKTDYYNTWKFLRGVAQSVFKHGYYRSTGALQTPLMNYFYAFVRKYAESNSQTNIIELRNKFYQSAQCDYSER